MNPAENNQDCTAKIDASCRLPLLVLFGGAALWLVVGLLLSVLASLTFHDPAWLANCSCLTYGHLAPAANDLLVYGFAIPAALGVILWIFARLSEVELVLPIVPFVAANLWHLGVLFGTLAIFTGNSSGYLWLEYLRPSTMLLGVAFVLIAVSAVATFGQRKERELNPAHWFLLAALLWFPWIYSNANLFLVTAWPVRGVAQAVINWWYANNLIFVWLSLVGIGIAFYFLPKFAGRPLQGRFYALFAFWTFMIFGTWAGIAHDAPVPAWIPSASSLATFLLVIPLLAFLIILKKTLCGGAPSTCRGGPVCYIKFGMAMFILSTLMLIVTACPECSRLFEFTWFGQAQVQLQVLGFAAMILLGSIYEILPLAMGTELPYKKFVAVQHGLSIIGVLLLVASLVFAGWEQGRTGFNPESALMGLRISTLGLLLLLVGSLMLFLNVFAMTMKWKLGLAKTAFKAVKAPLETSEVKP